MGAGITTRAAAALGATVVVLGLAGAATAAPAGGGHMPHLSLLGRRVPVRRLPLSLQFELLKIRPGKRQIDYPKQPVRFGQVEFPGTTVMAAGNRQKICFAVVPDGNHGTSGTCSGLAAVRRYGLLDVERCGRGKRVRYHVGGIVANGFTGLALERVENGTVERTLPVTRNAFAVSLPAADFMLHGVGDEAAERFELKLPFAELGGLSFGGGGCAGIVWAEAKGE